MRRPTCLILLVAAVAAAWPGGAGAQEEDEAAPQILRVAAISPWTAPDRPFTLTLQISNPTELALRDVSIRVAFSAPVSTRSALRLAIDEGIAGSPIALLERPLRGRIEPGEQRAVTLRRSMEEIALFRGIYPLSISLTHAGGTVALNTAVPHFSPSDAPPINVAVIMPVTRPTVAPELDTLSPEALESLALDELIQQLSVVASRPGARVTLALDPSLVSALHEITFPTPISSPSPSVSPSTIPATPGAGEATEAFEVLRRAAAAAGEIATVPFSQADLRTLIPADLRADLLRHITLGRTTIGSLADRDPSLGFLVPPLLGLDAGSIDALRSLGVRGAIVDPASLVAPPSEPADLRPDIFGPSFPISLQAAGGGFPALLPDAPLRTRFAGVEQGVLLAQAALAESMGSWQELPLSASRRIVVIAPERLPAPPALAALLDGLQDAPWVRLVTGSEAIDEVPPAGDPIPTFPPPEAERPFLAAARNARASHRTLTDIATQDLAIIDELDRLVLRAESSEWLEDPARGLTLAFSVIRRVASVVDAIDVAPRRITLTSRTGDAPVTLLNRNPFPVRVRVRLVGSKVVFPSGSSRLIELAPGDNTFTVPVEARAAGSFPVDVVIESPGRRRLTSGRLVLRSTAVSAVSLAIVGGSAGFLLLAWFRRTVRDRRNGTIRGPKRGTPRRSVPSRR